MKYWVYILQLNNQKRYTGYTSNLELRIKEHQSGLVKSTKNRFESLLFTEEYKDKFSATRREKWLKSGIGRDWLKSKLSYGKVAKLVTAPV